ncbi:hypothetical protein IIA79_02485 [bacterium]|nr:hypothetical protein [bacterium]
MSEQGLKEFYFEQDELTRKRYRYRVVAGSLAKAEESFADSEYDNREGLDDEFGGTWEGEELVEIYDERYNTLWTKDGGYVKQEVQHDESN